MPDRSAASSTELLDVDGGELRAEIARMRDREQIVDLHHQYMAMLDADDYDALESLFTDDAVIEGFPGTPVTGAESIAGWMRDNSTHHLASQRMISNHRIALTGDRARVVAAFRSAHLNAADDGDYEAHSHEGWYLSDVVRTPEGWRYARLKRTNLTDALRGGPTDGRTAAADEVYRHPSAPSAEGAS